MLVQDEDSHNGKLSLEYLFHPKSIAVVGVSSDLTKMNRGREYLESMIRNGYKGKLYPIGLSSGEVFGLKIYRNIKDVPDTIDYAISSIPAKYTPQLIADCATKRVKTVHMFTSGFAEIADESGKQLQAQITAIARQGGIRIIGPNGLGLYCPKTGMAWGPDLPKESGPVSFSSQSGGNCMLAIREGAARGLYFSKVISYGNASDLNEVDFLEYLTSDPETKIISLYIEGVKDGRRFFQALKQATKAKPVIVYKGGTTDTGARATASHTASIAGSNKTWKSLLKQAGAIQVHSIEEMNDVALAFAFISPPKGRNTVIMGIGGGASVKAADTCSSAGLAVPLLPVEIRQRLEGIYTTEAGGSFRNPIDLYWDRPDLFLETLKTVANYDQIDLLVIFMLFGNQPKRETRIIRSMIEAFTSLGEEINKRTAVVLRAFGLPQSRRAALEVEPLLYEAGFPIYPSIDRAATALSKFTQYHQNTR